ncbi:MAG: GDP-L-fucose synthase [Ignavibacteria bacterium]|nr:GDP-L-fucose synthase [Ignavibacteria bacterium]
MKILITGGSGLLGQYLNEILSKENEICTLYNENLGNCKVYNSFKINLTDFESLKEFITSYKPGVIIHTAAISRPESCDKLPKEIVESINIDTTKFFAEYCEKNNSKLIFTSTDLVYDGEQGMYLDENANLKPVSLYAETKVKSENEIRNVFENYIILRVSLLYGMGLNHSVNNFHIMLNNFLQNRKSKLFHDQYRTPLSLLDAAELIRKLIKADIKNETINFGGRERISRAELGEIVCSAGNFDPNLIDKISMNEIKDLHKVADVSMNTSKLNSFGLVQKTVEESVIEILNKFFNIYR